jgi:hypothetical protein
MNSDDMKKLREKHSFLRMKNDADEQQPSRPLTPKQPSRDLQTHTMRDAALSMRVWVQTSMDSHTNGHDERERKRERERERESERARDRARERESERESDSERETHTVIVYT